MLLTDNPFYQLGAAMWDTSGSLAVCAREKQASLSDDVIENAMGILISPQKRIAAEISWLPHVKDTSALIENLRQWGESFSINFKVLDGLPQFASINCRVFLISTIPAVHLDTGCIKSLLSQLFQDFNSLKTAELLSILNEQRKLAGIAPIADTALIEKALLVHKSFICKCVRTFLDSLPSEQLPDIIGSLIPPPPFNKLPALLNDLLDIYERYANVFFDKWTADIDSLIQLVRSAIREQSNELAAKTLLLKLGSITELWTKIAAPLLLANRNNSHCREKTRALSNALRNLCLQIQNESSFQGYSIKINQLQQKVFEDATLNEKVQQDTGGEYGQNKLHLGGNTQTTGQNTIQSLYLEKHLGASATEKLLITDNSIAWNNMVFNITDITDIIWYSEFLIENGIKKQLVFHVKLKTKNGDMAEITPENQASYSQIISFIWKKAGKIILDNFLMSLKNGEQKTIGNLSFDDFSAVLTKYNWIARESKQFNWNEITIEEREEGFALYGSDRDFSASISFQTVFNSRILEHILKHFLECGDGKQLTSAFPN